MFVPFWSESAVHHSLLPWTYRVAASAGAPWPTRVAAWAFHVDPAVGRLCGVDPDWVHVLPTSRKPGSNAWMRRLPLAGRESTVSR